MEFISKILFIEFVTHDVKRFIIEKPKGYEFEPGQATSISINLPEYKDKTRPFTFTSLNKDLILEFTIKTYPQHNGVTKKLHELNPGDELIIRDPWGTINFRGEGTFIAGGAGITPFISILRRRQQENTLKGNKLFFSNKTKKDIILEKEFLEMFNNSKEDLIFTLTREDNELTSNEIYEKGRITSKFLRDKISDFSQNFYLCGPPQFVKYIKDALEDLGAQTNQIVVEN